MIFGIADLIQAAIWGAIGMWTLLAVACLVDAAISVYRRNKHGKFERSRRKEKSNE